MHRFSVLLTLATLLTAVRAPAQTTFRVSLGYQGQELGSRCNEARISPNGRFVAFSGTIPELAALRQVYVRDLLLGTTVLASCDAQGVPGNSESETPFFSADGRWIAFESFSTNLVPGDANNTWDIFLKDLVTGAVTRVSVGSGGGEANGICTNPVLSADARYVAFESFATNLVPGFATTSLKRIYRKDRQTGAVEPVSRTTQGGAPTLTCANPVMSSDGRYVVFESQAADLVQNDTNGTGDVFRRDLVAGTTTRVSVTQSGAEATANAGWSSISADGNLVAFITGSPNLSTAPGAGIVLKDLTTGATQCVSNTGAACASANLLPCAMSADGRVIAFATSDNADPFDTNGISDVYVYDRVSGLGRWETRGFAGALSNGESPVRLQGGIALGTFGFGSFLSISADGRLVAFTSGASNLVADDANGVNDVFVRDRDCNVNYTAFGTGLGGLGGLVPVLAGIEGSCTGGSAVLVANARGGAAGILALSRLVATPGVPLAGGQLYPVLDANTLYIPFTLSGPTGVPGVGFWFLPGGDLSSLRGARLFHQAAVLDAGAPQGLALTNGLIADF